MRLAFSGVVSAGALLSRRFWTGSGSVSSPSRVDRFKLSYPLSPFLLVFQLFFHAFALAPLKPAKRALFHPRAGTLADGTASGAASSISAPRTFLFL